VSFAAWKALAQHQASIAGFQIRDLFEKDPDRFSRFSLQVGDLLLDYSKQGIIPETLLLLEQLAVAMQLSERREALFSGGIVNTSENRAALHIALRDPSFTPLMVNGLDVRAQVQAGLSQMENFVDAVRTGVYKGATHQPITDLISLGIGGSDLGPSMACEALSTYKNTDINCHFVSNVDAKTLSKILKKLNPATTLCLINSKTFTTPETLENAKSVREWLGIALGSQVTRHLIAITANTEQAIQFGILAENIFAFWDFVGGRYSVWSSVGLSIAILFGNAHFKDFLAGAHLMDQHFYNAPLLENMPVILALLGIWNINFWKRNTHAIIPYVDGLAKFPDYLQQLEMESNGKTVTQTGTDFVKGNTAPVIWGGVGCNAQHAYMQLLHQGSQIIPVDFLLCARAEPGFLEQHHLLVASCLSQSKALMEGNSSGFHPSLDCAINAKRCVGNRPSNTLVFAQLDPRTLGSLIALYEHKVFVQGVIWGINSFDQWGVELGKSLVKQLLPIVKNPTAMGTAISALDSSTQGLIRYLQFC
jgi:glucose-6-phosphate isomerase